MVKTQLTKEGFENLKKEHKELVEVKRPNAVERLQKARAMGDLSENSEYTAAKEELALVEGRIVEIEEILKHAEIVQGANSYSQISLGSSVTVETKEGKETFHIVGEYEADPINKKLSQGSPLGKALIGKKIGENIEIDVPAGKTTYKIVDIH